MGVLVLGVGNILAGDDGLGVHAVRALAERTAVGCLPPGVDLLEGGTAGLSLLPAVADTDALVIIDAVDVGAAPGTVLTLTGEDLFTTRMRLSMHQVGTADLLAAARLTGSLPDAVVLVGVQPATLAAGTRLSTAVAAAVPTVLTTVDEWCGRLAHRGGGRATHERGALTGFGRGGPGTVRPAPTGVPRRVGVSASAAAGAALLLGHAGQNLLRVLAAAGVGGLAALAAPGW